MFERVPNLQPTLKMITTTDQSKAANCHNHKILGAKLYAYDFPLLSPRLIHKVLSNRKQRKSVDNIWEYSMWEDISDSLPQGSILGLLLFNIFLCDMIIIIHGTYISSVENTPYFI